MVLESLSLEAIGDTLYCFNFILGALFSFSSWFFLVVLFETGSCYVSSLKHTSQPSSLCCLSLLGASITGVHSTLFLLILVPLPMLSDTVFCDTVSFPFPHPTLCLLSSVILKRICHQGLARILTVSFTELAAAWLIFSCSASLTRH